MVGFPAFTGDVTTSSGAVSTTLATVNSNVGTYAGLTVNGKGLVTAASHVTTLSGYGITDAVNTSTLGASTGVATLDSSSKLTSSQIPTVPAANVSGLAASATTDTTSASNISGGTLNVARLPALTGDATTTVGSGSITLATVNSNVGTFDTVTVNAKGLVTAASTKAGVANGLATLDGSGKLTSSQIPSSLVGAVVYQGAWNASTNSPTLASGTGTKGYYYVASTAGTTSIDGHASWNAGDVIIFDGTIWDKIDGVNSEVLSVAGRTGTITLSSGDISGLAASATTDTTNAANISSGTLPSGRLPALTGDVTTTAGTAATTLATVNSNVGTFNGITVNAKGLVTAASNQSYLTSASSIAASQLPALSGDVTTTAGTAATTVAKINGTSLSALASGILYNTTSTGVPSIATATQIGTALGATATPTASTVAKWDANSNLSANNYIASYATTATAAGTTTLTVSSAYQQYFTGTTTQTVALPTVSTLVLGQSWNIVNNSTGAVTVQSSGAITVLTIAAGTSAILTCISLSGTGSGSWSYQLIAPAAVPTFGSSIVSGTTNGQQYYLTAIYTAPASGNPTGTTASAVYPVGLYIYDLASTTWRAALPILSTPYDLSAYVPGVPTASADLLIFVATRAFTIPANFAGSLAKSLIAATASTVYQLQLNGSNVTNGTITFAASGTSATFGSISATSVAIGDIISIVAPASPDSTHANISFTILANLTQAT